MAASKIEWTDVVWNPVRGCTKVSAGCANCYAERQGARFSKPGCGPTADSDGSKGGPFDGFVRNGKWTGRVELVPDALDKPLRWRKPRRVFVNSMSDLFHEALPDEAIDRVFAVMALAPQHTFQVLTKRPERMREWAKSEWSADRLIALLGDLAKWQPDVDVRKIPFAIEGGRMLPLPNVWLGVSVEDQASADARIPTLLDTPAAVRWVSYEPALGPVDFTKVRWYPGCRSEDYYDATAGLDWLVVGGESGRQIEPRREYVYRAGVFDRSFDSWSMCVLCAAAEDDLRDVSGESCYSRGDLADHIRESLRCDGWRKTLTRLRGAVNQLRARYARERQARSV